MGMLIALLALLTDCAATVVRAPELEAAPTAGSARIDAAAALPAAARFKARYEVDSLGWLALGELLNSERGRLKAGLVAREGAREGAREAERMLAQTCGAQAHVSRERHTALARLANLLGKSTGELQVQTRAGYLTQLGLSGAVTPDLLASPLKWRADVATAWLVVSARWSDLLVAWATAQKVLVR